MNMRRRLLGFQAQKGGNLGSVVKKLPKSTYYCDMCKKYYMSHHQYVYETFEILPQCPKRELIICERCAVREYGSKNKKNFYEDFR